jgi:hypothetical protein
MDARPKGSKDSQDYLIDNLLPALNQMKARYTRHKVAMTLMVDMDSSMCHNGAKITEKISLNRLGRATHLVYSPDISPCDF